MLSRVRLFATPWTVAYQAPQSMEFSRQEYWSGLPFPSPGDLPNPGIEPGSPALQADALPSEPPGKPQALGIWKEGGERAARRAPRATAPMSTSTASLPAAARGPRRCWPVTLGGPALRWSTAAPGGPHRRQTTTPTSPRNGADPSPTTWWGFKNLVATQAEKKGGGHLAALSWWNLWLSC